MPKYGVHHVVLANAIDMLKDDGVEAAEILERDRGLAMLGAIGPDLFFWAPDYPVVRNLRAIYDGIEFFVTAYNDVVKPFRDVVDTVEDQLDSLVSDLAPRTQELLKLANEKLQSTLDLYESALTNGSLASALGGINLLTDAAKLPRVTAEIFNLFTPPRQSNAQEKDWYWFDMLHYRSTGDFARYLLEEARTDMERAYAYGYLSHIATDLTGHPYVNQIVGGPFRLHVQRHVTVENFIDSWVFREEYDGKSISQTLSECLELPDRLPTPILELLERAFERTYDAVRDELRPNYLTSNQIIETYDNFYIMLRQMEHMVISPPAEPFEDVGQILSDALKDLLEPPSSGPEGPTSFCSFEEIIGLATYPDSQHCYDEFFRHLESYFAYLGELMTWLIETIRDLGDLLTALFTALPVSVALAILYGLQLALYDLFQIVRFALVLEGLIYPEPWDLDNSHGRNLTTTFQNCVPDPGETYPRQRDATISHLVCPGTQLERPSSWPDFNVPGSEVVSPYDFIRNVTFLPERFVSYATADLDEVAPLHHQGLSVGNATDLTKWMITVASDQNPDPEYRNAVFTNFDLDADRGYFFRSWRGQIMADRVRINEYGF